MRAAAHATMAGLRARGVRFVEDPEAVRVSYEERQAIQAGNDGKRRLTLVSRELDEERRATEERERRIAEWLATASEPNRLTADRIVRRFARATGLTVAELKGSSRVRRIARVRMAAAYWIDRRLDLSMPAIGRVLGGRDHTTILHAVRTWPEKRRKRRRRQA